jgi:hypothetical protein
MQESISEGKIPTVETPVVLREVAPTEQEVLRQVP